MKILFIAAEATPMVKVGGLADVVGALPKALTALGHEVRVLLPNYEIIDHRAWPASDTGISWSVRWLGQKLTVRLLEGLLPSSRVVVQYLDCPAIFQRGSSQKGLQAVYANSNDPELFRQEIQRFAFFSAACLELLGRLWWRPDVVHCHDWHAALLPLMMRLEHRATPTVLTIHNLQNQGRWPADQVFSWLGWSGREHPLLSKRDRQGNLNILQLGIRAASLVNTVSPRYAEEILTAKYGEGLESDLRSRRSPIAGILNGIDAGLFNPATDSALVENYDRRTWADGKQKNKSAAQEQLGLLPDQERPLFVAVGRLAPQKGFDLIADVLPDIVSAGGQVALLGSGLPEVEQRLRSAVAHHPENAVLNVGFDAVLAQRLYAGGDFFLMPSRFEPCGLGQLIAMRYGTLPIVRDTGGLHDTVIDLDRDPGRGTGFVFGAFDAAALRRAVAAALQWYRRPDIVKAVTRAMVQDFSWDRSARQYARLYEQLGNLRRSSNHHRD